MQICWGAIDHGSGNCGCNSLLRSEILKPSLSLSGYDISNQTAYLDDMLRWSLGWLIKARIHFRLPRVPTDRSLLGASISRYLVCTNRFRFVEPLDRHHPL